MKKLIWLLIFIFIQPMLAFGAPIAEPGGNTGSVTVQGVDISNIEGEVVLMGQLPVVQGLWSDRFQTQLNQQIMQLKKDKVALAQKLGSKSVGFSYKTVNSGNWLSILVYTTTSDATNDYVDSFNIDTEACTKLTINDVLGVNAMALLDRFISDTIKQRPEHFNSAYSGISTPLTFAVENGNCLIMFDKNEIAPAYEGIVTFSLKLSDVRHVSLPKGEYVVREKDYGLKLIPLRTVCEGLGYTVGWDSKNRSVQISKGSFTTKVTPGKNSYAVGNSLSRELEAAPVFFEGRILLPISFFETILGATYSIDENETIIFSQYRLK